MKKRDSVSRSDRKVTGGAILGRERFAKISSVEGIALTGDMRRRIAEFDRQGLSAEERRRSIKQVYRKR